MSKSATHELEDEIDILNQNMGLLDDANRKITNQFLELSESLNQANDEIIRLMSLFRKVENISNLNSEDADGDHESLLDNVNSISNEALWGKPNRHESEGGSINAKM